MELKNNIIILEPQEGKDLGADSLSVPAAELWPLWAKAVDDLEHRSEETVAISRTTPYMGLGFEALAFAGAVLPWFVERRRLDRLEAMRQTVAAIAIETGRDAV